LVPVVFADAGLAGVDHTLSALRRGHLDRSSNTMTMYSPSDVRVLVVHQDNGGCGVPHEINTDTRKLECPPCETWLQKTPSLGWANHPGGVALTCDEIAENDRAEKQAQRAGWKNLAGQIAQQAGGLVPAAHAQPSLVEQILALDPAQKQALLVLLGATPAPAVEAAPAAAVVDSMPVEQTPPPADAALEVPKRRGGRPRKVVPAPVDAAV